MDVRNNVFANTLTGGTTSVAHVSVFLPSGGTSAMNLTLNNNGYYSGTDTARQGLAQVGTTAGTGAERGAGGFNLDAAVTLHHDRVNRLGNRRRRGKRRQRGGNRHGEHDQGGQHASPYSHSNLHAPRALVIPIPPSNNPQGDRQIPNLLPCL